MEISKIDNSEMLLINQSFDPVAENINVSFEQQLFNEINHVNNKIIEAETNIDNLALGKDLNLHEVMLSIQSAKISLETIIKVRDKALEGIHEILRMQI